MNPRFKATSTAILRGYYLPGQPAHLITRQPPAMETSSKPAIRQQMRDRRQALDPATQTLASRRMAQRLRKQPEFQAATAIGAYLPNDGEIDPGPLVRAAQRLGKRIYLPALCGKQLVFVRYRPGITPLYRNAYGIGEPRPLPAALVAPEQLDLVLVPLVAFDRQGHRLGMGGGFYDRSFAGQRRRQGQRKPRLFGLAHGFQYQPALPEDPWDVPLDGVATESRVLRFHCR